VAGQVVGAMGSWWCEQRVRGGGEGTMSVSHGGAGRHAAGGLDLT
jgi:hypothetical protein